MQLQEEKLPSYDQYSFTQCPAAKQKQTMYHFIDLRKEVLPLKGGGGGSEIRRQVQLRKILLTLIMCVD